MKKGMALLHDVLNTQSDDSAKRHGKQKEEMDLLLLALDAADARVVVKRPIKAPPLGTAPMEASRNSVEPPKPSYGIDGSVNRWDVYVQAKA